MIQDSRALPQAVFIRSLNVGKANRVRMEALREKLSARRPENSFRTLLQSGNVVTDAPHPELLLQDVLLEEWGIRTGALAFSLAELLIIREANPFPTLAVTEPKNLHVVLTPREPSTWAATLPPQEGADQLALGPRCVFLAYAGPSHLSSLGARVAKAPFVVTTRNWPTLQKVIALLESEE